MRASLVPGRHFPTSLAQIPRQQPSHVNTSRSLQRDDRPTVPVRAWLKHKAFLILVSPFPSPSPSLRAQARTKQSPQTTACRHLRHYNSTANAVRPWPHNDISLTFRSCTLVHRDLMENYITSLPASLFAQTTALHGLCVACRCTGISPSPLRRHLSHNSLTLLPARLFAKTTALQIV